MRSDVINYSKRGLDLKRSKMRAPKSFLTGGFTKDVFNVTKSIWKGLTEPSETTI